MQNQAAPVRTTDSRLRKYEEEGKRWEFRKMEKLFLRQAIW